MRADYTARCCCHVGPPFALNCASTEASRLTLSRIATVSSPPWPITSAGVAARGRVWARSALGLRLRSSMADPYNSIVSMLREFASMYRLAGHVVIGHIAKRPVDPYEGIEAKPTDVDVRHVALDLRVGDRQVSGTTRDCQQLVDGGCSEY